MYDGRLSLNLVLLLLLGNFVNGFRLKLMYMPLIISGQASLISVVFGCLCSCRSSLFSFVPKNKSSESKVKLRQASNRCKRVHEAAKLAYANKTKESITSKNLGSWDFRRIAKLTIVFSTKVNLLYPSIQRPGGLIFCI